MHSCAYTYRVSYQWDPEKAKSNRLKHGVDFADCVGVFEDPRALTMSDPHLKEERFVTIGLDLLGRVLVVSWTQRREEIRIISARKANRQEIRQYAD